MDVPGLRYSIDGQLTPRPAGDASALPGPTPPASPPAGRCMLRKPSQLPYRLPAGATSSGFVGELLVERSCLRPGFFDLGLVARPPRAAVSPLPNTV